MSHENRLRRLEVLATISEVHKTEMNTLIMQTLACPGQYTSVQIARAFDRLLGKQNGESLAAIDYLEREFPIENSSQDINEHLRSLGFPIHNKEVQLDLPFPELKDRNNRKSDPNFDLFDDIDDPQF